MDYSVGTIVDLGLLAFGSRCELEYVIYGIKTDLSSNLCDRMPVTLKTGALWGVGCLGVWREVYLGRGARY